MLRVCVPSLFFPTKSFLGGLNLRRSWKTLDQCHKILQESDEDPGVHENYTAYVHYLLPTLQHIL